MKYSLLTISKIAASIIVSALLVSCGANPSGNGSKGGSQAGAQVSPDAMTGIQSKVPAPKVLVSKGVIKSDNEVPIYSRITGQLNEVRLIDGTSVVKGQVLFTLDDQENKAEVELCEAELEQARIRMVDILIGQGYRKDALDSIPAEIVNLARIKSGCNVKEKELAIARERLNHCLVKAPLGGVVANVTPTSYAYVHPGETLCKIVDTKHLIVEFSVLETELRRFEVGTVVDVSTIVYTEDSYQARVRSIGSIVDQAGMIKVEAVLQDTGNLVPGMTAIVRL